MATLSANLICALNSL